MALTDIKLNARQQLVLAAAAQVLAEAVGDEAVIEGWDDGDYSGHDMAGKLLELVNYGSGKWQYLEPIGPKNKTIPYDWDKGMDDVWRRLNMAANQANEISREYDKEFTRG